ncbi:hypothetical protein NDU88_012042 [Pleurodeles waltl]|uniref:Uncharacterized protein n=1 Tax=Pleurodeles waltl TaxID=8319 RepID=A0AAV7R4U0_PLEWA|nr:hypothetical protein NDU88_012042 [Pleurodeles waltl]
MPNWGTRRRQLPRPCLLAGFPYLGEGSGTMLPRERCCLPACRGYWSRWCRLCIGCAASHGQGGDSHCERSSSHSPPELGAQILGGDPEQQHPSTGRAGQSQGTGSPAASPGRPEEVRRVDLLSRPAASHCIKYTGGA